MKELNGKVVVVTGGGSGIGAEVCRQLAAKGTVLAVCDINEAAAQRIADEITGRGGKATAHQVDVSSEEQMRALVIDVVSAHQVVDIVVNNAGIGAGPVETSEANLVNVASYTGILGSPRVVGYSTSKFAARGFTESLRMEFAGTSLAVSLVLPGVTRTSLMANSPVIDPLTKADMQARFDKAPGAGPERIVWWALIFTTIYGLSLGGATISSWTSMFFAPLWCVIAAQIWRQERGRTPIWTTMAAGPGVLMSLFLALPPICWGVAALSPDRPAEITKVIHEMGLLTLVTTDQAYVFSWIAAAAISLDAGDRCLHLGSDHLDRAAQGAAQATAGRGGNRESGASPPGSYTRLMSRPMDVVRTHASTADRLTTAG